jgi:23S rRNA (cytidine2498-2'-O)-methyltransferase
MLINKMDIKDAQRMGSAYWGHEEFPDDLAKEIGPASRYGRLFLSESPAIRSVWAQNVWIEPYVIKIASIGDAVKKLKSMGHRWTLAPVECVRRSRLIEQELRPPKIETRNFLDRTSVDAGCFALLDNDTMVASRVVTHPCS